VTGRLENERSVATPPPAVTVLMPVYNGLPFLAEAVSSVMSQEGSSWTLVIVDDGSTDGTWEYAQTLTSPRVRVLRNHENLGLYGTLEQQVRHVTTTWTAIVFQDDRLHTSYLQEMLSLTARHPGVAMFWAAISTINGVGQIIDAGIDSGREELIEPGPGAWRSVLLRGTIWTISGSFSRTSTLQEYGFRGDLPHCGDYDILLRMLRRTSFVYCERPLIAIREHTGQASAFNLAQGVDLRERLQIVAEQLRAHAADADVWFRMRLLGGVSYTIARRGLSAARHRRWSLLKVCVELLPRAVSGCLT